MKQYLDLLQHILDFGADKNDRTGTGTRSVFGHQMRFNLADGFPLLTTKKLHTRSIVHELLWFLRGETNVKYLNDNDVTIWNEWADTNGELGPVYGKQWRDWEGSDQISDVMELIKNQPNSRRMIVNAWNVPEIKNMALPPCHCLFQFYVVNGRLSCQLYQRSCDVFLGVPFNIASYAILTHMMAQQANLEVGDFVWSGGDVHLYQNHLEQTCEQLTRNPLPLCKLQLTKANDIFSYQFNDIEFVNYKSHPHISAAIAV